LTIINNSNFDSTSIVNNGICSNAMGEAGITRAHSSNILSHLILMIACGMNTADCKADVYMSDDCSGPLVGTVILDINSGIKNVSENGDFTFTTANPFQIQIDPKS
jgi:hypothetical protein